MYSSDILGRGDELVRIAAVLRGTTGERGVIVTGPPGMGRTTLLAAAAAEMAGTHRLLRSAPARGERRLAYSGLTDLLSGVDPQLFELLAPPQARALRVATLAIDPTAPAPDRRAVCYALLAAVRLLSQSRPVLVAVDDLHWLDLPSASALAYVVRRTQALPVRFLFSTDPASTSLTRIGDSFGQPGLAELRLGPLDVADLHHLVRERARLNLSRPQLLRFHRDCEGNPGTALDLARSAHRRDARGDPPAHHEDAAVARVAELPDTARDLVVAAALLSRPTERHLRAAVVGATTQDLERLVADGLARWQGDRLRLVPAWLPAAVTERCAPSQLRAMHARLAAVLDDPAERVRHLAFSAEPPDEDVAAVAETAAAAIADNSAAAELLDRACDLTPPERAADLIRRALAAARRHLGSGDVRRTRTLLERLPAGATTAGDRADALMLLAQTYDDDADRAFALAEQAAAVAEDGADRARTGVALASLAIMSLSLRADLHRAVAYSRRAVELLEDDGDCPAEVLATLAALENWSGPTTTGRLERALTRAEDHPVASVYSHPLVWSGHRDMLADRHDDARRQLTAALSMATGQGDEQSRAGIRLHLAELECRAGNLGVAAAHARACRDLIDQLGSGQGGLARFVEALVAGRRGEVARARDLAVEGERLAAAGGNEIFRIMNVAVQASVALSVGDATTAATLLRALPAELLAKGWREPTVFPLWGDAIEALAAVGELDLAIEYQREFQANAADYGGPTGAAVAARCAGVVQAASGQVAMALDSFADAMASHARSADRYEAGRTLLALGTVQRRARMKRAARGSLDAARAVFDDLGSPVWAERAAAESARIGGRVPAASLTATEERVAALAARGFSNREIAQELFVTEKTVEVHLSHVYRKVGVRSRTALAHRFHTDKR